MLAKGTYYKRTLGSAPTSSSQIGYTDTTILATSPAISNNTVTSMLTTITYPPGVWLITYQATVYFATAPSSFLTFSTYLSGPTGGSLGGLTQFGKLMTGTQTLTGINAVTSLSNSMCFNLTSSSAITLYVLVNANASAQAGGANTSNVQGTYITATRIG